MRADCRDGLHDFGANDAAQAGRAYDLQIETAAPPRPCLQRLVTRSAYKSSGFNPVFFAILASILGPISTLS
jgi:hypothetical protein